VLLIGGHKCCINLQKDMMLKIVLVSQSPTQPNLKTGRLQLV
jgi:hypothetical protein